MVAYFPILIQSLAATFIQFAQILKQAFDAAFAARLTKVPLLRRPNSSRSQLGSLALFRRDERIAADLHYCQRYSYRCLALGEPATSKAGHAAPVALPLANAFPPYKSGSRLRFVQNFLLCFALPLSVVSAQTPQPTSQPSGQSEQQIQPAQPNQPPPRPPRNWGPNGLGNAASGLVMNLTQDTVPPQLPPDLMPGGVLIFAKTLDTGTNRLFRHPMQPWQPSRMSTAGPISSLRMVLS